MSVADPVKKPAIRSLKNRIHRVGVELEGGWPTVPKGLKVENIVRDGSVKFPGYSVSGTLAAPNRSVVESMASLADAVIPKMKYVGEIPSPVMELPEVEEWMLKCYPPFVNETCGLHTHVSFVHKINYMRLMTPQYTVWMVKGLQAFAEQEGMAKSHPIWKRLKNSNHEHCSHVYLGDNQVKIGSKDFRSRGTPHSRYTAINYCWSQYKTVECRLLPMMETPEQGVRAVKEVFRLTNKFLSQVRQKEIRAEAKVALTPGVTSHYRIQV